MRELIAVLVMIIGAGFITYLALDAVRRAR